MKKNRSLRATLLISVVLMFSAVAFAQTGAVDQIKTSFQGIGNIINTLSSTVVKSLATLFATLAMVAFFYGIVEYIWGVRNSKPEKITEGNRFMAYGLLALFVMFSVWGIIFFVQKIFDIQNKNTITIPEVIIKGGSSSNNTGTPGLPTGTNFCYGKPVGVQCSMQGGTSGFCQMDTNNNMGCYAGNPCPSGQAPSQSGCISVEGF